jgi:hypothetical protein
VIGRQPPMSSFDKSQTRKTKRKTEATAKKIKIDDNNDDDGYSE